MIDMLRMLQGPIVSLIISLVVVRLIASYTKRQPEILADEKRSINRIARFITFAILLGFGIVVFLMIAGNRIPRSDVDHSIIKQRIDQVQDSAKPKQ